MPLTLMREAERLGGVPVKWFVQVLLWLTMTAAIWGLRARRAVGKGRIGAWLGVATFAVAMLSLVPMLVGAVFVLPVALLFDRLRVGQAVTS